MQVNHIPSIPSIYWETTKKMVTIFATIFFLNIILLNIY